MRFLLILNFGYKTEKSFKPNIRGILPLIYANLDLMEEYLLAKLENLAVMFESVCLQY